MSALVHALALVGALALAVLTSGPAAAAPRPEKRPVLVLRLEAPGALGSDLIGKLDQAVRQEVAGSKTGLKLLPPPALDLQSMEVAAGCGDEGPECLANIGSTLGAKDVLRAVLTGTREKARLQLSLVRVKDQKARAAQVELTDLGDEVVEELRWHVAALLGDKRPAPAGALVLVPAGGTLDGVEAFLDDKKLPLAELAKVAPGERRLELHKEGAATVIWTGVVRPGRETKVPFTFERAGTAGQVTVATTKPEPRETGGDTPAIGLAPTERAAPAEPRHGGVLAPVQLEAEARPRLVYTWVLAGAAAVATTVGVYFWTRQQSLETQLADDCKGTTVDGRFVCRSGYQSCADFPDRAECREGATTETATWVAFPLAGALAGATVAAFFLEDGPEALFGAGPAGPSTAKPEISASVYPLEGGLGASLGARY